ncbi:hypothetical protein [Nocardia stercoris]|uniref:Uncharacterized protein n=1 Tax=Nocardia stercoris TaxID=2483361 RepID=A0A3M2L5J0_9NOCA|nr:hypothetical protein [Nocardia stercoris]RMI32962.1 hypothetical protein EBN03_13760 [Nocardia stercoris]
MIKRLIVLAVLPTWLLVGLGLIGSLGTVLAVVVLAFGSWTSSVSSDLHYQCESAVGPEAGVTVTSEPESITAPMTFGAPGVPGVPGVAAAPQPTAETPTTNPFADLTLGPQDTGVSDWQRACLQAMRTAPYQQPPLRSAAAGAIGECARQLALAQVGRPAAPGTVAGDPAVLPRTVVYQASGSAVTGQCLVQAASVPSGGMLPDGVLPGVAVPDPALNSAAQAGGSECPGTATNSVLVLPNTVAAQSLCGQRVDPAAMSPGDLVFWDYRGYVPTRAGVAVDAIELVGTDPDTGTTAVWRLPTGPDVRIKRVLAGAG